MNNESTEQENAGNLQDEDNVMNRLSVDCDCDGNPLEQAERIGHGWEATILNVY